MGSTPSKKTRISNACKNNINIIVVATKKRFEPKSIKRVTRPKVSEKSGKVFTELLESSDEIIVFDDQVILEADKVAPNQCKTFEFGEERRYLTIIAEIFPDNKHLQSTDEKFHLIVIQNRRIKDYVKEAQLVFYFIRERIAYGTLVPGTSFKIKKGESYLEQTNFPPGHRCIECGNRRRCDSSCKLGKDGYYYGDGVFQYK